MRKIFEMKKYYRNSENNSVIETLLNDVNHVLMDGVKVDFNSSDLRLWDECDPFYYYAQSKENKFLTN